MRKAHVQKMTNKANSTCFICNCSLHDTICGPLNTHQVAFLSIEPKIAPGHLKSWPQNIKAKGEDRVKKLKMRDLEQLKGRELNYASLKEIPKYMLCPHF